MARLENWQFSFGQFLRLNRDRPFDFAEWNCVFFCFDGINSITGNNHKKRYEKKFTNERGALKALKTIDKVSTSRELFGKLLGEEKSISLARAGDIVFSRVITNDCAFFGHETPGVCNGPVSYFLGENGLIEINTLELEFALWVS